MSLNDLDECQVLFYRFLQPSVIVLIDGIGGLSLIHYQYQMEIYLRKYSSLWLSYYRMIIFVFFLYSFYDPS